MSSKANKLVEEIGNMTVLELADLVKAIETTFGVSAAMPVAAAAATVAAAPVEESKSEYKVTLKEVGDKKIDVIKALRKVTDLNLTDAKKAVDEAPSVIAENADKKKAEEMKEALEAAGAKVELS